MVFRKSDCANDARRVLAINASPDPDTPYQNTGGMQQSRPWLPAHHRAGGAQFPAPVAPVYVIHAVPALVARAPIADRCDTPD